MKKVLEYNSGNKTTIAQLYDYRSCLWQVSTILKKTRKLMFQQINAVHLSNKIKTSWLEKGRRKFKVNNFKLL